MIKFLDLFAQYKTIQPAIDRAIKRTIEESAFIGGPALPAFEAAFAAYQQAGHCVAVANGTDAIEIALEALALPPGSEVIVPANTFISSSEAVTRGGHRVVFADVDDTYTLDLSDVERRIGPKTRAIIAVHLYGHPCDMAGLLRLARRYDIRVIEDCAQAHGAEVGGRRVGAIGDVGTFSFYPGKNLGAYGDGGAITTDDGKLAETCRMIANHGRIAKYDHVFEGRNSRLDGMQAAILNAKLPHLDDWVDRRNEIARRYATGLAGLPGIALQKILPGIRHAFHLFVVRTSRRDALMKALSDKGIQTGIHYPIALPKLAAYAYLGQMCDPMRANQWDTQLLSLPIGEHLSEGDVDLVVEAVGEFSRG